MRPGEVLVHATAVASAEYCILITGPSGSGKSDLALRLIGVPPSGLQLPPFSLVSDDQVLLAREGEHLIARPPATIAGRMEVRGLGLLDMPYTGSAQVRLIIQLTAPDEVTRMPEPATQTLAAMIVPVIPLYPFEPSAPLKAALALRAHLPPALSRA